MEDITYVGMDVHKESIRVAALVPGRETPWEYSTRNDAGAARRLARKLTRVAPGPVRCCYEAGPCGYGLQRQLIKLGVPCQVIAPSLIPIKPGERIKTDRRDALKLSRMLRAGALTEVRAPTAEEEAVRDLCRARQQSKQDLLRCRHRLSKWLLRSGIHYTAGKRNWTAAHRQWLRSLHVEDPVAQAVFDDYLRAVEWLEERIEGLKEKIESLAALEPYAEPVALLRCFRGVDTVTAMTVVTELHGFVRFESPRALMAYLGLVPSEHSSGGSRRQGAITKTGNVHVRRVLVEAAWHYRHRPVVGVKLRARRQGQPGWVIAAADRAMQRLYRRHWQLLERGKPTNKATVAVARELAGLIWAVLYRRATQAGRP